MALSAMGLGSALQSHPPVTRVLKWKILESALGSAPEGAPGNRGAPESAPESAQGNWGCSRECTFPPRKKKKHLPATPSQPRCAPPRLPSSETGLPSSPLPNKNWKKGKDPHPQDRSQHLDFTKSKDPPPAALLQDPIPVYSTTKMSVVRQFPVLSKDEIGP